MADGGGKQTIFLSVNPDNVLNIEVVPVSSHESIDRIKIGLASTDFSQKINAVNIDNLQRFESVSDSMEIQLQQSWSETLSTISKRRYSYGQRYQHVVIDLQLLNGTPVQRVIELPEYCRPISLDLTRESSPVLESAD